MSNTVAEVKGIEDLIAKLNAMPDKLEKKVVRAAVRKGAAIIRDKARQYVPVDEGDLKKSIAISGLRAKRGVIGFKIRPKAKKGKKSTFYGKFVEFGTYKMHARPYMRPAYDEAERNVLDEVINEIRTKVDEVTQ